MNRRRNRHPNWEHSSSRNRFRPVALRVHLVIVLVLHLLLDLLFWFLFLLSVRGSRDGAKLDPERFTPFPIHSHLLLFKNAEEGTESEPVPVPVPASGAHGFQIVLVSM